jgi:hypothetical protein
MDGRVAPIPTYKATDHFGWLQGLSLTNFTLTPSLAG